MVLNIDLSTGSLVGGINTPVPVNPLSLAFYSYALGIPMQIYLLQPVGGQQPSQQQYEYVLTTEAGALQVQIDDGTTAGAAAPLTQQVTWIGDANQQQFYYSDQTNSGGLAMNTAGIIALLTGSTKVAYPYLRVSTSFFGTILVAQIAINPGIPGVTAPLAPGLTPISLQQALAMFVKYTGNPNGYGFVLNSPLGHQIEFSVQDNGDGSARVDESAIS